jgi:hypothetical protein
MRPEPSRRPLIARFQSEVAPVFVPPGTLAHAGRAAYYRAEAARIDAMAAETAADEGREHFAQVAQEYRRLADTLDAPDDDDHDDLDADALVAGYSALKATFS